MDGLFLGTPPMAADKQFITRDQEQNLWWQAYLAVLPFQTPTSKENARSRADGAVDAFLEKWQLQREPDVDQPF